MSKTKSLRAKPADGPRFPSDAYLDLISALDDLRSDLIRAGRSDLPEELTTLLHRCRLNDDLDRKSAPPAALLSETLDVADRLAAGPLSHSLGGWHYERRPDRPAMMEEAHASDWGPMLRIEAGDDWASSAARARVEYFFERTAGVVVLIRRGLSQDKALLNLLHVVEAIQRCWPLMIGDALKDASRFDVQAKVLTGPDSEAAR